MHTFRTQLFYFGFLCFSYNYQVEDKDFRRSGYNARNVTTMDIGSTPNSKPNPFVQGSQLQQEAENVVQAFLMNEAGKKSMQQEFVTDQLDSGIMRSPNPGKIEDLPSPTGPYGEMQVQNRYTLEGVSKAGD